MLRRFLGENNIDKRSFLVIAILFLSVFGWYYATMPMINTILSDLEITHAQNLAIWATFYLSIIGTSILGTFLSDKFEPIKFLYAWTVLGIVTSFLPALLTDVTLFYVWGISLLFGASFGLGLPSCLAYFADCTIVENRGRVGGVTFLIAAISVPLLAILFRAFDLAIMSVIFALLRGMGLIVFFLKPENQPSSKITTNVSFVSILRDRTFLLYFVAWSMFPLVDKFERVLVDQFLIDWMPVLLDSMSVVEPLVAGLSVLIAGLLCDLIGRKKIILSGFVALGVAYALIGLNPHSVISWYLYFIVDGVAWGIFLLTFVLILWGDLAQPGTREKYYMLGSFPFFLSYIIPELLTESFVDQIPLSAAFSLAAFFLFVAVMPLVFAPETLPEKKIELRRLRSFAEDAKKAREKYEEKMKKNKG
ncbi:MAG TPA: MFS transporter [Candidatus Bathyarchaeota archaeon]|nr:MFS transporter [Candidatus Bathyarchaeota archaeon]